MRLDPVIRGGTVVTASAKLGADVGIAGGRVVAVARDLPQARSLGASSESILSEVEFHEIAIFSRGEKTWDCGCVSTAAGRGRHIDNRSLS